MLTLRVFSQRWAARKLEQTTELSPSDTRNVLERYAGDQPYDHLRVLWDAVWDALAEGKCQVVLFERKLKSVKGTARITIKTVLVVESYHYRKRD